MFQVLNQSSETCLVAQFNGKVRNEDYKQFLDAIEECMESSDSVNLVLVLTEFEFFGDLGAAKKDFRFPFTEYGRIGRAALVGDQKWITWFARLLDPFTHTG